MQGGGRGRRRAAAGRGPSGSPSHAAGALTCTAGPAAQLPCRCDCVNRIPHGRGLGSSAAAIVAGVVAARVLSQAGDPVDVSGSSYLPPRSKGIRTTWPRPSSADSRWLGPKAGPGGPGVGDGSRCDWPRSPCARRTACSTEEARGLLPGAVPHGMRRRTPPGLHCSSRAFTTRPELLLTATEDRLHQAYRAGNAGEPRARRTSCGKPECRRWICGAGPTVARTGPPRTGRRGRSLLRRRLTRTGWR